MTQLEVLRAPHVPRLLASGVVGRIPSAIAALAAGLVMRDAGLGYHLVGWAVGAFALGLATGGPILGRIVDRRGQSRVLVASSLVAASAFVLVDLADDRFPVIVVAMAVAGLATPPLEPCLRALWPDLVDDDDLDAALSLDAAAQELVFIIGPALVATAAAVVNPEAAVWMAALLGIVGACTFARTAPSQEWEPSHGTEVDGHWLGPLRSTGLVLLFGCLLFQGAAVGALTITVVAYAEWVSPPGGAGALLAVNAFGALLGALVYGAVGWSAPLPARLLGCSVGMVLTYALLVTTPTPGPMFAIMVATGFFLAPMLAVSFSMVGRLSEARHVTEAFAWLVTLFTIGNAAGSPLAGIALGSGLVPAALVAVCATAGSALLCVAARSTWAPAMSEHA